MFSDRRERASGTTACSGRRTGPTSPSGCEPAAARSAGQAGSVRYETARKDYREALALARRVAAAGGLDIRRRAVDRATIYDFMPLAHLRPGMAVLVERGRRASSRPRSTTVDVEDYDGPVYDLEVDADPHATSPTACSCTTRIYRFRGADIRNILEFEEAFPDATVDRARAELPVDPDHPRRRQRGHRQQPRPQAQGAVDRPGPRATPSSATTPTTRPTRRSGSPHEIVHAPRRRRPPLGRHRRLLPDQRPEPGASRSSSCASGIPYKVVGGTRFYDRREVKDALAYLQGRGEPGRRGQRQAGPQRAQAGHRRHHRRPARRVGRQPRHHRSSRRCAAPTRPASAGRAVNGHRRRSSTLLDELAGDAWPTGPAPAARGGARRASGYVAELEAEHTHRGRGPAREPGRAGRRGPRVRDGRRVPRADQPGGRHRRARRRRLARSCS